MTGPAATACVVDPADVTPGTAEGWFGAGRNLPLSHARTSVVGGCDRIHVYGTAGGTPMVTITFGPPMPELRTWHGARWDGPDDAPSREEWQMSLVAEHVEFFAHYTDNIVEVAVLLIAFWRRFGGTLVADEAIRAWIRTSTP